MSGNWDIAQQSDTGLRREHNEDACGYRIPEPNSPQAAFGSLFVVADGVGGLGKGEVASQTAVEEIITGYYDLSLETEDEWERIQVALERANVAVREQARQLGVTHIGSTATGYILTNNDEVVYFTVGDSRVYRIRDGKIQQLTNDQSAVFVVSDDQGGKRSKSRLTSFLGQPQPVQPDGNREPVRANDVYLACSDGLWGLVPDNEILAIVNKAPARNAVQQLIQLVHERGANDNVTVSITRLGVPPRSWRALLAVLLLMGVIAIGIVAVVLLSNAGGNIFNQVAQTTDEVTPSPSQSPTITNTPPPSETPLPVIQIVETATPTPNPTETAYAEATAQQATSDVRSTSRAERTQVILSRTAVVTQTAQAQEEATALAEEATATQHAQETAFADLTKTQRANQANMTATRNVQNTESALAQATVLAQQANVTATAGARQTAAAAAQAVRDVTATAVIQAATDDAATVVAILTSDALDVANTATQSAVNAEATATAQAQNTADAQSTATVQAENTQRASTRTARQTERALATASEIAGATGTTTAQIAATENALFTATADAIVTETTEALNTKDAISTSVAELTETANGLVPETTEEPLPTPSPTSGLVPAATEEVNLPIAANDQIDDAGLLALAMQQSVTLPSNTPFYTIVVDDDGNRQIATDTPFIEALDIRVNSEFEPIPHPEQADITLYRVDIFLPGDLMTPGWVTESDILEAARLAITNIGNNGTVGQQPTPTLDIANDILVETGVIRGVTGEVIRGGAIVRQGTSLVFPQIRAYQEGTQVQVLGTNGQAPAWYLIAIDPVFNGWEAGWVEAERIVLIESAETLPIVAVPTPPRDTTPLTTPTGEISPNSTFQQDGESGAPTSCPTFVGCGSG